ncbi:MAG: 4-hydroxy-tetrahydrodipicolinate reductase [Planctomycetota bacterium]
MPPKPLTIALVGGAGRVGRLLRQEVDADDTLSIVGDLRSGDEVPADADVLIDFSSPAGLAEFATKAADAGVAIVSGTTGLDDGANDALAYAGGKVAVLHATNTSLGVALLNRLAADAARVLGDDADIEIVELHHNQKKDAPSGTADTLARRILDARDQTDADLRLGRVGATAVREPSTVGVHSLRLGDVVGRHEAHFATTGERLCVWHDATDRRTFARGAIRAARWIVGRSPGLYGMDDVLADALGTV